MQRVVHRFAFPIRPAVAVRVALSFAALVGVADVATAASKVYRCGNVFQDLPCDATRPTEIRPADKAAAPREATIVPVVARSTPRPGTGDRLVLDPPATAADATRR